MRSKSDSTKNSFQFDRKDYLTIAHGAAMGTKMALAFANISMWDTSRNKREDFVQKVKVFTGNDQIHCRNLRNSNKIV